VHIEILVEDQSGGKLVEALVPKILGTFGETHYWRIRSYKGIGKIPKDLRGTTDPSKRILLDQLPRILKGYGKTPGIDAVMIILDTDDKDCIAFLNELKNLVRDSNSVPNTIIRLAIEEIEAWYLGDLNAILAAYPKAKRDVLNRYVQDSVCGTWELLADALYPGGVDAINKVGWPLPGQIKCEWAERIGPRLDIESNSSPSFSKFREGLKQLTSQTA
jgi:hypothetical protein